MKKDLHPVTQDIVVKCGCGAEIRTSSTLKEFHTEVCSACHPFYTGKQKLLDTAGRIEKFRKKYGQQAKQGN